MFLSVNAACVHIKSLFKNVMTDDFLVIVVY